MREPERPYSIRVSENASFTLNLRTPECAVRSAGIDDYGRPLQVCGESVTDEREVTIGLDFGTSCIKAVIGDSALGKAFAVPLVRSSGLQQYLLPTRIFQTERRYSVQGGVRTYRDLKLSLLSNPNDRDVQRRFVALLAIVIRLARGWLLAEHEAVYRNTRIVWRLSLGLPTRQGLESPMTHLLQKMGLAAWSVAGREGPVAEALIDRALHDDVVANGADVEVRVVPEIAAQIYGFVVSNSFDKKARNIYLMADVGSGTVDASLFHVKAVAGARWNFSFFTSVVEPHGVINLHRQRVGWWQAALETVEDSEGLTTPLRHSLDMTDHDLIVPDRYEDYYRDVEVRFDANYRGPDNEFYSQVVRQVCGAAFHSALNRQVPESQMSGVPFFLCGGGSRMAYYERLAERLAKNPNFPNLSAKRTQLHPPGDLVAAGLLQADYDRLSVAYGLSRMESGSIVEAEPLGSLPGSSSSWANNYVDKDQC